MNHPRWDRSRSCQVRGGPHGTAAECGPVHGTAVPCGVAVARRCAAADSFSQGCERGTKVAMAAGMSHDSIAFRRHLTHRLLLAAGVAAGVAAVTGCGGAVTVEGGAGGASASN